MSAPTNYRELARECMREAEAVKDAGRKQTLVGIARLYSQTALSMEGGDAPLPGGAPTGKTSPEAGSEVSERPGDLGGQGRFPKTP
jgi:hypothetical protein